MKHPAPCPPARADAGRRRLLRHGGLLLAATAGGFARAAESTAATRHIPSVGVAAGIDRAATLKPMGVAFLTAGVSDVLMPDKDDAAFEAMRVRIKELPLPVLACNGFIRPAHLRCVGPDANPAEVLVWAETAFRRLAAIGGKFIVFGSSGARRLPDGWPRERADDQFVDLLARMGPLAEKHGVTVVLEQLQESECNYINRIGQAAALIRRANHSHVRLLADLYHMSRVKDRPEDLKKAMDVIVHIEIAEHEKRTAPGVAGDDFRAFFRVLIDAGYRGAINIEGRWEDAQLAPAVREIQRQYAEA